MRIAVISSTALPCPVPGYGGLEQIAWLQAQGLAKRGHTVMLVAAGEASVPPLGVELHRTTLGEPEGQAYSGYWQKLPSFDAIIDNSWQKWSYVLKNEGRLPSPILGVLHAPCNTMYSSAPPVIHPCLVAISKDQAVHASELWGTPARVAYNGVDPDFYKPAEVSIRNDRYLFLARMCKIKGPHIAVDVARKCRVPLDLVGDDRLTGEPDLAHRLMAESKNGIMYVGPVSREKTVEFFRTRKALLHMNQHFREPFGLAPIEAQSCGLPIVAFDNGAMRETVKDGETGFLVKSQEEVEAIIREDRVASIDPAKCREWASQFSVQNMVERYISLCEEAISTGGW